VGNGWGGLDLLGLGVGDLGVTLNVLGLGDGGFEIGLEDSIVLGFGDEGGKIGGEEDEEGVGSIIDGLGLE
ncbi:hypothetical protein KI387_011408, partial [Taxus chinensis]